MTDSQYRLVELNSGTFAVQRRGLAICGPYPVLYAWETMSAYQELELARTFLNKLKEEEREDSDRIEANKVKRVIE
jgi:hypothetical protein